MCLHVFSSSAVCVWFQNYVKSSPSLAIQGFVHVRHHAFPGAVYKSPQLFRGPLPPKNRDHKRVYKVIFAHIGSFCSSLMNRNPYHVCSFSRSHDAGFMSIQKQEDWWRWAQTSLLDSLYKYASPVTEVKQTKEIMEPATTNVHVRDKTCDDETKEKVPPLHVILNKKISSNSHMSWLVSQNYGRLRCPAHFTARWETKDLYR